MRSPNGQRVKLTCEYCGKIIETYPYRAKEFHYCSRSCRAKAKPNHPRNRVKKICLQCGKVFEVVKAREHIARFCSKSCRSKHTMGRGLTAIFWKGGPPLRKCEYCGKDFFNRNAKRFCSKKCFDLSRQKRETGICINCGRIFMRQKSHAKRYKREYCSFACYKSYAVGENSLQWRGGSKPYPKTFNREFKRMIRERDNYTCAICKEYGDNVHHINYAKNDTSPENCITLCRSCHCKTNTNREYWQSLLCSN